jgi:uncharacterized membrane protein YfcA
MPVYFFSHGHALDQMWPVIGITTAGVVAGTLFGGRVLERIPEPAFRRVVAVLLALLGVALLARAS